MKLSKYFYKGQKNVKDTLPLSLNRLIRGCFISQEASGIFRLLPLGLRVLKKTIKVIEEEMDKIAVQVELPFIQSTDLWKKSGRYDAYGKEMLRLKDRNNQEFILPPTCEEGIFDVFEKICESYKDLPKTLYQITWKFRDELRPRGGLLRGRLFLMKDAYSFASNEIDAHKDYINNYNTYVNIFKRLNLEVYSIRADSGEIGGDLSHEFVIKSSEGDGEAFLHKPINLINSIEEIRDLSGSFSEELLDKTKVHESHKVIELAHIFYYDTKYATKLKSYFTDKNSNNIPYYGGCYGIGVTRIIGLLSMMDFWPTSISPFTLHIVSIFGKETIADNLYEKLIKNNIEVLYDDRNLSFGEKKYDLNLIGIPKRVIVGGRIEFYNENQEVKYFNSIEEFTSYFLETN